jgi:hypothetical protein
MESSLPQRKSHQVFTIPETIITFYKNPILTYYILLILKGIHTINQVRHPGCNAMVMMSFSLSQSWIDDEAKKKEADGSVRETVRGYTADIGCVEKSSTLKTLHATDEKLQSSWLRFFWYPADSSVVNAYVLVSFRIAQRNLKLKDFHRNVVPGLDGNKCYNGNPGYCYDRKNTEFSTTYVKSGTNRHDERSTLKHDLCTVCDEAAFHWVVMTCDFCIHTLFNISIILQNSMFTNPSLTVCNCS